ncbi:MAG: hypothetical protein WDA30_27635 [Mycolicibacterium sp.]
MTQVLANALDQEWHQLNLADDRVAAPAQESAHSAGVVAVVDYQVAVRRVAEQATPILRLAHGLDVLRRQPVLPHQPSAQILSPRSLGVGPTPFSEALVAPRLVRLPVLPAAFVRARLAVRAQVLARLRERGQRQILPTVGAPARLHVFSLAWSRDSATQARRPLDQPCHADVLLEVANR